jgi:hypothetical protein
MDYLAQYRDEPDDILHFGVKGMKWGVRNDSSRAARDRVIAGKASAGDKARVTLGSSSHDLIWGGGLKGAAARMNARHDKKSAKESTSASVDHLVNHTGPETHSQRYERIRTIAKAGRTKDLSDDDMRFFNNRSQAIHKVNAYTAKKPHWAKETGVKVLQNTATAAVGGVAAAVTARYVTKPLIDGLGKLATSQAAKLAALKVAKTTVNVGAAAKPFGSFA